MTVELLDGDDKLVSTVSSGFYVSYVDSTKFKFPLKVSIYSNVYALNSTSFYNNFFSSVPLPSQKLQMFSRAFMMLKFGTQTGTMKVDTFPHQISGFKIFHQCQKTPWDENLQLIRGKFTWHFVLDDTCELKFKYGNILSVDYSASIPTSGESTYIVDTAGKISDIIKYTKFVSCFLSKSNFIRHQGTLVET